MKGREKAFELLLDRGSSYERAGQFPTLRAAFKAGFGSGQRFSIKPVVVVDFD